MLHSRLQQTFDDLGNALHRTHESPNIALIVHHLQKKQTNQSMFPHRVEVLFKKKKKPC